MKEETVIQQLAVAVEAIGNKPGSYDVALNNLRYLRRELLRIIGGRVSLDFLNVIEVGKLVLKMPEYTKWGEPRSYHSPVILECHGPEDWRIRAYTKDAHTSFETPQEALQSAFIWEGNDKCVSLSDLP
ncbi:MAG: hypothetical protein K2Y22_04355 [Candidatus Obscuribacterales bacterium]|nr:hypothetical protein [Candidatus Obscuribacterales bacterium]